MGSARTEMAAHIDVHFHALPPAYKAAVSAHGGDPSGFPEPEWSPEAAVQAMEALGSSLGIMSITAPGVPITGAGEEGRKLSRELNMYLGELSSKTEGPFAGKFAFFGALPDFNDVEGTIAEINFLFKEQKLAAGVGIYTNYRGKLPGHPDFKPIWAKLQEHKALVHMHPTASELQPGYIAGFLPQPIVDYPQNTTRAAIDLVLTGTVRACPDVDIILSHAGGTLPFLGARVLGSLSIPPIAVRAGVTHEQAIEDMARFYWDIALSTSPAQLDGLLHFVQDKSRILFGSDFPYAPMPTIMFGQKMYKQFLESSPRAEALRPEELKRNALELLNKHSSGRVYNSANVIETGASRSGARLF